MKIVFATNNSHKLDEARKILGNDFEVVSLADINCHDELPETSNTLEGNALQKANYVWEHFLKGTNTPVVADDTGLEVDALGGEPGVRSARYDDNSDHDSEANMRKLLAKLAGKDNRKARFRTSIALLVDNGDTGKEGEKYNKYAFEGIVDGNITNEKHGTEGFGYDPIFQPDGYDKTFAELGAGIKNTISHRARAMQKLADFIKSNLLALCLLIAMLAGGSQIAGNGAAAQGVGTWQCYWAYNDITEIQPAGKKVFVLSSERFVLLQRCRPECRDLRQDECSERLQHRTHKVFATDQAPADSLREPEHRPDRPRRERDKHFKSLQEVDDGG